MHTLEPKPAVRLGVPPLLIALGAMIAFLTCVLVAAAVLLFGPV